jgi:ornithine cyclodeaminase
MRHYSEADLDGLIGIDEAVEGLRLAFLEYADGAAPVQPRVPTDANGLRLNTMAAAIPALGYCGAKVYTALRARFSFLILLFSMDDGRLVATFDAGALTQLRTAAVSVLAAESLARPDSRTLAVFGTGAQATGHVQAFARRFPLEAIYVVGIEQPQDFARETARRTGVETRVLAADDAVSRADIVVTATRSATPLFDGARLREGTTLIAVGSARSEAAEIDPVTVARCARIVVESAEQARHEAGDLLKAAAAGVPAWDKVCELGQVLAGRAPGRQSAAEINLYESLGFALEDVAIAAVAYTKLRAQGRA